MSGSLQGKVAVVTGASKGIGAAIAKAPRGRGRGGGGQLRVEQGRAPTGSSPRSDGRAARPSRCRATCRRRRTSSSCSPRPSEAFGRLDILVNNAGVYQFAPLEEVTEAEFHRQFDTNVLGPILATQEALKHFGDQGGSVINISSVASANAMPERDRLRRRPRARSTRSTATSRASWRPRKIRVNTIAPGGVETEGAHAAGIIGSDFEKQMVAGTPLGRIGQPDDIAKVAVFLASDAAGWITGERIAVAGGFR